MITDDYKYKITLRLYDENPNETFAKIGISNCTAEIETDSLDHKFSLTDILSIAKACHCYKDLFVEIDIEDSSGEYVDHDEFALSIDYEKNKIEKHK